MALHLLAVDAYVATLIRNAYQICTSRFMQPQHHAHVHLQDGRMFAYVSSEIRALQEANMAVKILSKAVEQAVSQLPALQVSRSGGSRTLTYLFLLREKVASAGHMARDGKACGRWSCQVHWHLQLQLQEN